MMLTVLHPLSTLELDGFRHSHMLEYNNLNEFEYLKKNYMEWNMIKTMFFADNF
jgi:hypothetical protein